MHKKSLNIFNYVKLLISYKIALKLMPNNQYIRDKI